MPAADGQGGEETAQETMRGWSVRESQGDMEMKGRGHLLQGAISFVKPHDRSSLITAKN